MNPVSADLLQAVEDRAVDLCLDVIEGVVELMQVDGYVYGDEQLGRQERINAYLAMEQSGELRALRVVNPKLAAQYDREFYNDVGQTPAMRSA